MPDAVHDQALDIVASQIKTLADAIDVDLTPESAIPVRWLDAEDITSHLVVVGIMHPVDYSDTETTNERDVWVYPIPVYFLLPHRPNRDNRSNKLRQLRQSVRRYYQHRRRFDDVSDTGTSQLPCYIRDKAPDLKSDDKIVESVLILARFLETRTA